MGQSLHNGGVVGSKVDKDMTDTSLQTLSYIPRWELLQEAYLV